MEKEITTVLIAALPISELRGAIPFAITSGISPLKAYALAVLGNLLPVIPILFFLEPVSNKLRHFKLWDRFFNWLFERTRKKAGLIERLEAVGLMLFVAIPLPVTGAWTGCVAASLFKIRFRYAFLAIALGVALAGIIVLIVSSVGLNLMGK